MMRLYDMVQFASEVNLYRRGDDEDNVIRPLSSQ